MKIIKGRNHDITMTCEYEAFPYCMICDRALERHGIEFVVVNFKTRNEAIAENDMQMVCAECANALKKTLEGDT